MTPKQLAKRLSEVLTKEEFLELQRLLSYAKTSEDLQYELGLLVFQMDETLTRGKG